MSVVNVKVANLRPHYNNLREWMQDEDNVYIGRKGVVFIDGKRFLVNRPTSLIPTKSARMGPRKR